MNTTKNNLPNNLPNASKLYNSLRHLDYSNVSAIADIVDNSIDAGASQIWINIHPDGTKGIGKIEIIDNGKGMDEEDLDEALKLGSEIEKNPACDLGLYGMGLVTASISMGKELQVVTKSENDPCLLSKQDLDAIDKANQFIKILEKTNANQSEAFERKIIELQEKYSIIDHGSEKPLISKTGTIVSISKIDNMEWKTVNGLASNLMKSTGQVYRKFLKSDKIRIYINGKEVKLIDPIYDFNPTLLFDSEIKLPEGTIRIFIFEIHDYGHSLNREKRINQENQGFYIIRNHREISTGETLGLFTKHNYYNTFRAEFMYPASLDGLLSTNFSKHKIILPQAIRDKVAELCNPFIKQVSKHARNKLKTSKQSTEDFSEVEKYITQKSHLLKKPKKEIEKRDKSKIDDKKSAIPTGKGSPRLDIKKKKRISLDDLNVKFGYRELGEKGPIYEADQYRDIILIYWNIDHPFYLDFIAPNADKPDVFNPICFLVYSMANAELISKPESTVERIIENIRWDVGRNLAVLLR